MQHGNLTLIAGGRIENGFRSPMAADVADDDRTEVFTLPDHVRAELEKRYGAPKQRSARARFSAAIKRAAQFFTKP